MQRLFFSSCEEQMPVEDGENLDALEKTTVVRETAEIGIYCPTCQ